MPEYTVYWENDFVADSPEEAAEKAFLEITESIVQMFEVKDEEERQVFVTVDFR